MSAGEVVKCAHCGGSGWCDCGGCNKVVFDNSSGNRRAWCSSCGGVGKVWVGPNNSDNDDDDDEEDDDD